LVKNICRNKIKRVKESESESFLTIKLGKERAYLEPVNLSEETVSLITTWRKKYWYAFGTKFNPTKDNTRKWLKEKVIHDPNKILFLIKLNNKKIGHMGLCNFNEKDNSIEIDNVIRAYRQGYPGLMEKALKSLIKWGFQDLKLSKVLVKVFSDNYKAINLYQRCGLLTVYSIPLKRSVINDGWKWEEAKKNNENVFPDRYMSVLEITKERYKKINN